MLLQCDTQADSFVLALDAATGRTIWKTDRQELPSWGTPTVMTFGNQAELVTNAANYIRGYDARTGQELWRLGGSSKITAPTPIRANDLIIVASGRRPERPIFAIRPDARGDVTLDKNHSSSRAVAWSKNARGPYMPTPIAYGGILYSLNNDGVFDAYDVETGNEIYRQRLDPIGSGFSASPVAADGRIYLSNEDGDMLVIEAGREFRLISTNPLGELVMATPALSDGVMYVRSRPVCLRLDERRARGELANRRRSGRSYGRDREESFNSASRAGDVGRWHPGLPDGPGLRLESDRTIGGRNLHADRVRRVSQRSPNQGVQLRDVCQQRPRVHTMVSDPVDLHDQCPALNRIGVIQPGETRDSSTLSLARTCGFHDHSNLSDTTLLGRIIVE